MRPVKPYRNDRLLALANEAPWCMSCGEANMGQVVGAHWRAQKYGAGMGVKPHDLVAYLCMGCHDQVDGRAGALANFDREAKWMDAFYRTMHWLLSEGHLVTAKPVVIQETPHTAERSPNG